MLQSNSQFFRVQLMRIGSSQNKQKQEGDYEGVEINRMGTQNRRKDKDNPTDASLNQMAIVRA